MTRLIRWFGGLLGWIFQSLRSRIGQKPEYILYTLEGEYTDLPPQKRSLIWKKLRPSCVNNLQNLAIHFQRMTEDRKLKGVILHLGSLKMSLSQAETIRGLIDSLRRSGKRVIAWSNNYTTQSYLIACGANEIFLQPGGMIQSLGFHRRFLSLRELLSNLGVDAQLFQTSSYKSSIDIFTKTEMSNEFKEMTNWLLDHSFQTLMKSVANSRKLDPGAAASALKETPCTDIEAVQLKLIDKLIHEEDLADRRAVQTWEAASSRFAPQRFRDMGRSCALISIDGMIVDGYSKSPLFKPPVAIPHLFQPHAGDRTIIGMIRRAQRDRRIGSVVIYVNSPGGTLTASESIRAAIEKLAANKPVVVSMGPIAASGGYWVATSAHKILASASSLTGSIGVVSGKFAIADLMKRYGIHAESISKGGHELMYEWDVSFSEEEKQKIQRAMDRGYALFLDRVSSSRKIDKERLNALAEGRVWTGEQAREHGLVDQIGGLDAAVDLARELAQLSKNSRVETMRPGRRVTAPMADTSSALLPIETLSLIGQGTVMVLCPFVPDNF